MIGHNTPAHGEAVLLLLLHEAGACALDLGVPRVGRDYSPGRKHFVTSL